MIPEQCLAQTDFKAVVVLSFDLRKNGGKSKKVKNGFVLKNRLRQKGRKKERRE